MNDRCLQGAAISTDARTRAQTIVDAWEAQSRERGSRHYGELVDMIAVSHSDAEDRAGAKRLVKVRQRIREETGSYGRDSGGYWIGLWHVADIIDKEIMDIEDAVRNRIVMQLNPHRPIPVIREELRDAELVDQSARFDAPMPERVRHVKSGHICTVLHRNARLQAGAPLSDMDPMVVYEHGGTIWVRPASEFDDGRFVPASPTSAPPSSPADDGWLPIEMAPKDGTRVLLYGTRHEQPFGRLETYGPDVHCGSFSSGTWHTFSTWGKPTHWRQLPAPPATTGG